MQYNTLRAREIYVVSISFYTDTLPIRLSTSYLNKKIREKIMLLKTADEIDIIS